MPKSKNRIRSTTIHIATSICPSLFAGPRLSPKLQTPDLDQYAPSSQQVRETPRSRRRDLAKLLTLLLILVRLTYALNPQQAISQYGHTVWRVQDGVFPGAPQAITQTADGYLWIGTKGGLVRFDGVRFTRWSPPEGTNMIQSIVSLFGARDGALWIGAENGVGHLNGESFTFQSLGRVNAIVQDQNGKVWIARSRVGDRKGGPLCQVARDSFQCFGETEGIGFGIQGAEPLIGDRAGGLWIGSTKGICHWTGKAGVTYFPKALERTEGAAGVLALELANDGTLLVGSGQKGPGVGLQTFEGDRWRDYSAGVLRGSEISVAAMLRDHDGGLWIATTDAGLIHVNDGLVDTFTQSDGLSSNSIQALYEDREGNVWAVSSQGLDRFRELPVVTVGQRQGLTSAHVRSVFASPTGRIWAGNQIAVDSVWQGKISTIGKDKLPGKATTSILEDNLGRFWLGMDADLYVMEGKRFRQIRTPGGESLGVVFGLVEGIDKHIYAVVTGKPQRIFDIVDTRVVRSDPLPTSVAGNPFTPHPKGGIWLPQGDGRLAHYLSGTFETFGKPFKTDKVTSLAEDQQGTIWGASSLGIVHWTGNETRLLNTTNGLPCNDTHAVIFDSAGTLWVSTRCGILAIPSAELQRFAEKQDSQIAVRTYDVLDGAEAGFSPFQPQAAKSPDGRIWFVNEVSLQFIDPGHLPESHFVPPVVIEEVQADAARFSPPTSIHLPARTRNLRIDYTALSFVCPQRVRFRYKLDGRDTGWQDAGTRRQAFYTDLPPGNYRFRVIASNNDGVWNETGASLPFVIPPAFTQSILFKTILLLALVGFAYLAFRLRVRQISLQLRARMYERLAERERIARDLHDTFFQGIQGLLMRFHTATNQLQKDEPARRIFEETLTQSDRVMLEGRELVLDLRATASEPNDLPAAFADFGEQLRKGSSGDFRVVVNGSTRPLHPVVFEELFKIGKQALGNAFRHASARSIEVELNYEASELRLRIRDDGTGIDSSILRQGHRDGHFGLPGMRERARKIGAHFDVWSHPGAGTEVELRVAAGVGYASQPNFSLLEKIRRLWRGTEGEDVSDQEGPHRG